MKESLLVGPEEVSKFYNFSFAVVKIILAELNLLSKHSIQEFKIKLFSSFDYFDDKLYVRNIMLQTLCTLSGK